MKQMIKAGFISYLNAYPYYFPFEQGYFLFNGESILGYPQELNQLIYNGNLDISLISSMEYACHFKDYILVPNIGLSSHGCINSVKLLSKFKLPDLSNKRVAITKTSATSRAVLKIILAEKRCKNINYLNFSNNADLATVDAYLVIGDEALLKPQEGFQYDYDLAKIWQELYGIDILFAVAAVRRDSMKKKEKELTALCELLNQAPQFSLNHKNFYDYCRQRFNLPISVEDYFKRLNFAASNKEEQQNFLFQKFYQFNLINQEIIG